MEAAAAAAVVVSAAEEAQVLAVAKTAAAARWTWMLAGRGCDGARCLRRLEEIILSGGRD